MPTAATLHRLRDRIRRLEQGGPPDNGAAGGDALPEGVPPAIVPLGLPAIDRTLPWGGLPRGAVHEILCGDPGDGAPTAFLLALIGRQKAAGHAGPVLWVSCRRDLFAPALPVYGCDPADFLFVRCARGADVLWAMEDGLRCPALAAVAGDVGRPDFSATRRLQLAANRSGVPLFCTGRNGRWNGERNGEGKKAASWPPPPPSHAGPRPAGCRTRRAPKRKPATRPGRCICIAAGAAGPAAGPSSGTGRSRRFSRRKRSTGIRHRRRWRARPARRQ